eukprot:363361-Chlamydomonas_euryale.AAC.3
MLAAWAPYSSRSAYLLYSAWLIHAILIDAILIDASSQSAMHSCTISGSTNMVCRASQHHCKHRSSYSARLPPARLRSSSLTLLSASSSTDMVCSATVSRVKSDTSPLSSLMSMRSCRQPSQARVLRLRPVAPRARLPLAWEALQPLEHAWDQNQKLSSGLNQSCPKSSLGGRCPDSPTSSLGMPAPGMPHLDAPTINAPLGWPHTLNAPTEGTDSRRTVPPFLQPTPGAPTPYTPPL